jgi:hypothetical protein
MPGTLTEGLLIGSSILPRLQLYFAEFLAVNAGLEYHKYLTKSKTKQQPRIVNSFCKDHCSYTTWYVVLPHFTKAHT